MNKKTYYIAAGACVLFFGSMAISGCDLKKIIHFDVPGDVQTAISVDPEPSLSDAQYVWDRWASWVDLNSEQLSRNIDNANERVAMIENVTAMGIGALGEASNAFPGGALLFSGLSLAVGLFLKKPGTDKVVAKEKEDSYNAGLAKGKELAKAIREIKEA